MEKVCPRCKGILAKNESFYHEYAWEEYCYTYFFCASCEQWYEESWNDRKTLGIEEAFKPISIEEKERRCLHWSEYVPPFGA
jgi:hypothetical protein